MLPFTADVLFSTFEQSNRALWPLPLVALVLALAALLATLRPTRIGDRALAGLLAAAWLWTGYGHHYLVRVQIDFSALGYAPLFVLEGLLLAWSGVVRDRLSFRLDRSASSRAGFGLALAAALALPVADGLSHGWLSARLVGLAPGPTALFTLGLLLMNARGRALHLAIVPVLWVAVAGTTAWILAIPQDLVLAAAGILAFALVLWRTWRG